MTGKNRRREIGDTTHFLTRGAAPDTLNAMPRMPRATPGGLVYHVLNRANAGLKIFRGKGEYAAFEQALAEAHARVPVRLLAYCLLPDHWHLVIWPKRERELSEFMRWLTVTHTRRWHAQRNVSGSGHLYQGRYRSFPVEPGESLVEVIRYVESNPKRSRLVRRAEAWPWSSLHHRLPPDKRLAGHEHDEPSPAPALLDPAPPACSKPTWLARVNGPFTEEELEALRKSAQRGTPFGSKAWTAKVVKRLGLEHTTRPRGRPRKHPLPAETDHPESRDGAKKHGAAGAAHRANGTRRAASPAPRVPRARA